MYLDINLNVLSGKILKKSTNNMYSKSQQTKYSGFVKLGVRWAERDNVLEIGTQKGLIPFLKLSLSDIYKYSRWLLPPFASYSNAWHLKS